MAKHVVLDSIARSGTTLLSALLRSQKGIISFCPGFNEPLSCTRAGPIDPRAPARGIKLGGWPHGICRQDFVKDPDLDFHKFQNESLARIVDFAQYYGLSENEWRSIIFESNSPADVRKNLEDTFPEVQVFCYRWNQTLCYFNEWISNGSDYLWLSMIRDPLDRACSSLQKHSWPLEDSLEDTVSFATKLQCVADSKKFYLLYYEDLVQEPKHEMTSVLDFMDVENESINLKNIKGSNGEDFIPQSSVMSNTSIKSDGYVKGKKFDGVHSNQVGRYKRHPSFHNGRLYEQFKNRLVGFPQYKRYFSE
jgi:hypothetical protein